MRLDFRESIQKCMAKGVYDPDQTGWVKRHLREGSVFIDIGASFGYYTSLAWSLVGRRGRVFSFEPSPHAYSTLKHNLRGYKFRNITLVNAAVGRGVGEITIYMPPAAGLHSPSAFVSHEEYPPLRVPLTSLDEFAPIASLDQIDMVKMDVEGSEPDVLKGMSGLIGRGKVKRIICEFNSWWLNANNTTVESLHSTFLQMGFEIEDQTTLQKNLPAIRDEVFDLQDFLYKYVGH